MISPLTYTKITDELLIPKHDELYVAFRGIYKQWFTNAQKDVKNFVEEYSNPPTEVKELLDKYMNESEPNMFKYISDDIKYQYATVFKDINELYFVVRKINVSNELLIDLTRLPWEFWIKPESDDEEHGKELGEVINNLIHMIALLMSFINAYDVLSNNLDWKRMYSFAFINLLNLSSVVSRRPRANEVLSYIDFNDLMNEYFTKDENTNEVSNENTNEVNDE